MAWFFEPKGAIVMSTELVPVVKAVPELGAGAMPDADDVLAVFLAGRNGRTLEAYRKDLEDFARFLSAGDSRAAMAWLLEQPHGRANAVALGYRAHLVERRLASATIARRLSALRSIIKLARTLGLITWALDVESPRSVPYRDTVACGTTGWRALLETARAAASWGTRKAIRDVCLVRFLHDLGLRRGEAAALDLADVELERSTISVISKGRTDPIRLTMPEPLRLALVRWMLARGAEPGPLFVRLDPGAAVAEGDRRLTGESIRKIVASLARRAQLTGPVRPHGLRHLAVTQVLDSNGGDIRAAQEFARHADPKTTMRYDRNRRDLAGEMARLISE